MATHQDRPPVEGKKAIGKSGEVKSAIQLSRVKEFAGEVKSEFGKIVWPARKQTVASTAVVLVLVLIVSIYLGAVDLLLGKIVDLILR